MWWCKLASFRDWSTGGSSAAGIVIVGNLIVFRGWRLHDLLAHVLSSISRSANESFSLILVRCRLVGPES